MSEKAKKNQPTTAVSTIAVQSGNTRIVTALLQSKDTFQLKIQELQPCMTDVGNSLDEASTLLKQHKDVISKIQKQQSPVTELLRQVDETVSHQKSKAAVYDCMADNLSQAWQNVNHQLQKRLVLLELAVSYYSKAKEFTDFMKKIQDDLTDNNLPIDANMCDIQLQHLQYIKKSILASSLHTLNAGHMLLEELQKIGEDNLGDARPNHVFPAVQQATSVIERHMESLHDQKYRIDVFWNKRKLILEQCLQIFTISKELEQVKLRLTEIIKENEQNTELGESITTTERQQKIHGQLEGEVKDVQNRVIHLLHKLEKAPIATHPLAEDIKTKAYCMLSECTDFFSHLENRNLLLCMALSFFTVSQQAFRKLEKIENQLRTLSLQSMNSSLAEEYTQLKKEIEDIVNPALQEGRTLLDKIDRYDRGSQGIVKKDFTQSKGGCHYILLYFEMVKELENLYHQVRNMIPDCTMLDKMSIFYKQYNEIEHWLHTVGNNFLRNNTDMGNSLNIATLFFNSHKKFHNDIKMKSRDIEEIVDTCSSLMTINKKALNEIQKKDEVHQQWRKLCILIEKRIYLSELYVSFLQHHKEVSDDMANVEKLFKEERDKHSTVLFEELESKLKLLEEHINSTRHSGTTFIDTANKSEDPYLDIKTAILYVENLLKQLKNQYDSLFKFSTSWKFEIAEKDRLIWEQFRRDVEMTTENVNRLEGNLFPILSRDMDRVGIVVEYLKRCIDDTAPKIKEIQLEVEAYFKRKDFISQIKSFQEEEELMKSKLQKVYTKLQKDVASYQILVSDMSALFHNLKELDNLIEKLQSEYRTTVLSQDATQAEIQLQKLDTTHTSVTELLKKIEEESKELIHKINDLEPCDAAINDREKILHFITKTKEHFGILWEEQKKKMKDNLQMCHFNTEFRDINKEIEDLRKQLKSIENMYKDSLEAAKASLWTFQDLQKGVEHLDQKIRIFIGTFKYSKSGNIQTEIESLRTKWTLVQAEISKLHHLINIAIEYFQLIEEVKEWFKEGSQLLVTIARNSSLCKVASDADKLLAEVELFLTTGKTKQEEKFYRISILVLQLFDGKAPSIVEQLTIRSKDMIASLEVIRKELYSLAENLRAAEEEQAKERIVKEIRAEASRQLHTEFSTTVHQSFETIERKVRSPSPIYTVTREELGSPKLRHRTSSGKPPVFTVPLVDNQVTEGSKQTFYCQIEAGHNPSVKWYKDDVLISNNSDYSIELENNICTLTIDEILPEDSGIYKCKVENECGQAETTSHLHVKESRPQVEPPHFIKELEPGTVKEKESFRFCCQVTGNPLPLVSWYKKDICIDSSPDYVIIFNNGFCQLHIKEVHLDDKGCYSCKATNKAGQAECSATLNVLPLAPIEAPFFLSPLSNVTVKTGHKLYLETQIRGYPTPIVTWSHNGKIIKEKPDVKIYTDGNKSVLEVAAAFSKDAGTYTITARNLAGEAISSSTVNVKEKPIFRTPDSGVLVKPVVKHPLRDQTVYKNNKVQLDCVIAGQPEPEVIWYHNGKPVKESNDLQLLFEDDHCILIINEACLEDTGIYRCTAVNPAGETSSQCVLSVKPSSFTNHQRSYKEYTIVEEKIQPPKYIQLLEDFVLVKGQNMKLECKVVGEPEIVATWYKDGIRLNNGRKYKITHDKKTGLLALIVHEANQTDEGKYMVQASNEGGEAKCYCSILPSSPKISPKPVTPEIPPKFLILLRNSHVLKGQEAKFDCLISGTPKPTVTWYFEEKLLKRSEEYIITEDGHRHSLIVLNTADKHNGRYSVTAENNSGKATSTAFLTVEEPPKTVWNGTDERRKATLTTQQMSLLQNNSINRTTHQETSSYELRQSSSVGYHEENVLSSVHKVNYDVSKINHTMISSADSPSSTKRVTPMVSVKPSKSLPPKFVKPVDCAVVEVGKEIILQGQIEGYPEPTVTWSLGDMELFSKSGLSISFTDNIAKLQIPKATEKDSGRYTCTASNIAGTASSTADVVVKPHRNPPKFVHPLQPCIFKSGDRVQLDVEVMGTPLPHVKWFHNGNLITDSLSMYTKSEDGKYSLIIPNATADHSGKLTVKAINIGGEAQCTVDLIYVDNASVVGKAVTYKEVSVVQQTKMVTLPSNK